MEEARVSIDRRTLLLSALGLAACRGDGAAPLAAGMLDAHAHLFGSGDGGSGCFLSEAQRRHLSYGMLKRLLDLPETGMDEAYVDRLLVQARSSPLQRILLFAQDGRYDREGRLDRAATPAYCSNDWLFAVCERDERLLPCASIHPKRRDALAELERCKARGARAVKVHPPIQDVDPADPALLPFWERAAALEMVLVVHTGGESAAAITDPGFGDPARLENALRAGCTVIAAHAGFGSFLDGIDFFPSMQAMVRRHERLFCDTAVLASAFRWRNLPRLLADEVVLGRTLHASDWPFPSNPAVFWHRLPPGSLAALSGEANLFTRDLRLKQALGLPAACFTRGSDLFA
jgi:predicted TIM-barrel fold metal-dependent hydrolase